jgi:3-phenylpropionate/trans-cinnamate dioxygenase ferredoxin subunit
MPVTIKVLMNGPYRVEIEGADLASELKLVDHEGNPIPMPGPRFSLCRCGASAKKPFCDRTHTQIGFQGAEQAQRDFDATQR